MTVVGRKTAIELFAKLKLLHPIQQGWQIRGR